MSDLSSIIGTGYKVLEHVKPSFSKD